VPSGSIGRQSEDQAGIPILLMLCYCLAEYGIERPMEPLNLIGRRFVGCCPKFLDAKQLADFPNDVSVDLLALVTQNGERGSEAGKHLFDQHLSDGLSFFVTQWESFRPLGE